LEKVPEIRRNSRCISGTVLTGGFAVPAAAATIATTLHQCPGAAIIIAQLMKEDAARANALKYFKFISLSIFLGFLC